MPSNKERLEQLTDAWEKEAFDKKFPAFWEDFIDRVETDGLLASEWISTKLRLPEIGQRVLVWNGYGVFDCDYRTYNGGKKVGFVTGLKPQEGSQGPITHWQPLPQPPKDSL